ncbi:hypothetical protein MRX96_029692 [Rhipicephalus microplus]
MDGGVMTTMTTMRRCPKRRRPVALVGFAVIMCACRCCCLDEATDSGPDDMEAGSSCPPGQVPCGNSSSECLPRRLHCDGFPDCREGEDEKGLQ